MKSSKPGANISAVEIGNVDRFGLWLLIDDKEYFLPYKDFPWFRSAKLDQIFDVELRPGGHLHWPALDVDLSLDSLKHPEAFPLIYR